MLKVIIIKLIDEGRRLFELIISSELIRIVLYNELLNI